MGVAKANSNQSNRAQN